jgi:hypothetical protein
MGLLMRFVGIIVLALTILVSPVRGDDKTPRQGEDKKETKEEKPKGKLDKTKERIGKTKDDEKSESNPDSDSPFTEMMFELLINWFPYNFHYAHTPYPYFEKGMFTEAPPATHPIYIEAGLSAFSGFHHVRATGLHAKLKVLTGVGLEYDYSGFSEKTDLYESNMKMHRVCGVLNLFTFPYGVCEFKFGLTNIIDINTGGTYGFDLTLTPVRPLIFRGQTHYSKINGNDIGDHSVYLGFSANVVEFYGGYRFFTFPGSDINGPTAGVTIKF